LRTARLARGDAQAIFAQRIGVSVPTLRAMERGSSTVAVGYWAQALWALGRLDELGALLRENRSLIEQFDTERGHKPRQRAPRRSSALTK
jgi:transcriptional regulator with XRE-family HTH domain